MLQELPTLAATSLLAAVFLNPYPRNVLDERQRGFRSFISFAAGLSVAYVFIDLLPELSGAGEEFLGGTRQFNLPFPEYVVYASALLGFVLFYGLERMVRWSRGRAEARAAEGAGSAEADERMERLLKLGGSAAYVALVTYLMQDGYGERGEEGLVYYLVAMTFHFTAMRHSLRYEYTEAYDSTGRWVLALACLLGWGLGVVFEFSVAVLAPLLGFLGGMLIMNTTVMELPPEKEGRFIPFVLGSLSYALLLMFAEGGG